MNFCRIVRNSVIFVLLISAPLCSRGSTWKALSATYDYPTTLNGTETSFSIFGGNYFSDGQYQPQMLLKTTNSAEISDPLRTAYVYSISFLGSTFSGARLPPPQIDLTNLRADFSSLEITQWWEYKDGSGLEAAFGWEVGSPGWVPIIANGDGTYTASWLTIKSFHASFIPEGRQFSFTFTPVPVPAAAWLFGSVLAGLVGINRRNMFKST